VNEDPDDPSIRVKSIESLKRCFPFIPKERDLLGIDFTTLYGAPALVFSASFWAVKKGKDGTIMAYLEKNKIDNIKKMREEKQQQATAISSTRPAYYERNDEELEYFATA
jgi:hypothetical protein